MVSVDLSGQLRWLAVSCEGLSLFVATYKDGATDISFYDVRSLVNGGRAPFARQTPPPSPGNKNVISAAWNPGSVFELGHGRGIRLDPKRYSGRKTIKSNV